MNEVTHPKKLLFSDLFLRSSFRPTFRRPTSIVYSFPQQQNALGLLLLGSVGVPVHQGPGGFRKVRGRYWGSGRLGGSGHIPRISGKVSGGFQKLREGRLREVPEASGKFGEVPAQVTEGSGNSEGGSGHAEISLHAL